MNLKLTSILLIFLLNVPVLSGQSRFSRAEVIADIDSLIATLKRVHYNPYLHISESSFDDNVKDIKRSLKDSVAFKACLLNLYKITASLHDGHSMPAIVQPVLVPELQTNTFLPFRFIFDAQAVYISGSDYKNSGIPYGSRIRTINNVPVEQAAKEYQMLLGGSENFRREIVTRLMGYFLFLHGVYPPYTITYTTPQKKTGTLALKEGVNFMEMLQKSMPHLNGANEYRILEEKIAYLSYTSMDGDLNAWGLYLDSLFNDIRAKGIKTLCIDVRNNSGGNSLFNNYLLAYITKNKFLQASGKSWRISDDYKKYQRENGNSNTEYQSRTNGSVWDSENCTPAENPVIADSIFNGKTYLLTGAFTYSSANMLADAFKTFHVGSIIGEATGEYTNDFGEVMTVSLPNSKIRVQLTTSFEFGADCNKKGYRTVQPDISIVPSLEDKLSGTDKALLYLLKTDN